MTTRTKAQKIGAQGHKWLSAHVEEHPHWLARDLGEDFGVDAEFELTENGLRGDILKVQIKTSERVDRSEAGVKFVIERRYFEYADACRVPVIFVRVDLEARQAWYLWLQDWLLEQRASDNSLMTDQQSWVVWVPQHQTVSAGLSDGLKSIARWEGKAQLALSLIGAMRAAAAINNYSVMRLLADAIVGQADELGQAALNALIEQAAALRERLRGSVEGNAVSAQLLPRSIGSSCEVIPTLGSGSLLLESCMTSISCISHHLHCLRDSRASNLELPTTVRFGKLTQAKSQSTLLSILLDFASLACNMFVLKCIGISMRIEDHRPSWIT